MKNYSNKDIKNAKYALIKANKLLKKVNTMLDELFIKHEKHKYKNSTNGAEV